MRRDREQVGAKLTDNDYLETTPLPLDFTQGQTS